MKNSNILKLVWRAISLILTISVFYFAYKYVTGLINNGELNGLTLRWDLLVVAGIIFFISYLVFALHWLKVGKTIDKTVNNKQLVAFFASQPYKYLPTSFFTFSFRAKYAHDVGMTLKNSSLAQLVENVNRILSGFLVGALFYSFEKSIGAFLILILSLLVAYILIPNRVHVKFRKKEKYFAKVELGINFLLACVAWIITGVAFWLVGHSLGFSPQLYVFVAANAVANVIGTIALFAPGGIGVRELVLIFFQVANPIIVVWRLVTFVCDMVFGFAAVLLLKYSPKSPPGR